MNAVRLFLAATFFPAFVLLVRGVGTRSRALRGIFVLVGVGLTGLVINFPFLVGRTANELGISTGGDLVLYSVVLVLVTLIGYMVGKFRRLEQRLSKLVHEVAVNSERPNAR